MSQSWMQGRPADVGSFVKTLEWYIIVLRWRAHRCWLHWSVHWCLWNRLWGLLSEQMFLGGLVTDHKYSKHQLYLHCFQRTLPHFCRHITVGHQWGRKRLALYSDNSAVVHVLNKKYSTSPDIMRLLRRLVLQATWCNFTFLGTHIRGKTNILSDALSRLQVGKFRQLAPPGTETLPCKPPYEVMFN